MVTRFLGSLLENKRTPDRKADQTATWSLLTLRRALRKTDLPHIAKETIRQVLHASGYSYQRTRTWCRTGYALRKRKSGTVTVYDLETPAEFGQAIAIAKGTPACPLVEPEDLLDARIVGSTPQAASLGIRLGITGREAVELAEQLRPDIVVMDVAMPELNGIEATRRVVAANPHAKVIALSMHKDSVYVREKYDTRRAVQRIIELAKTDPKRPYDALRRWVTGPRAKTAAQ